MKKSKIFSAVMACIALLISISQGVTVKAQEPSVQPSYTNKRGIR